MQRSVALPFDAGPGRIVNRVLDALERTHGRELRLWLYLLSVAAGGVLFFGIAALVAVAIR